MDTTSSSRPVLPPKPALRRRRSTEYEDLQCSDIKGPIFPPEQIAGEQRKEVLTAPKPPLAAMKFLKDHPHLDIPPTSDKFNFKPIGSPMPTQRFISDHQCPKLVRIKTDYYSPIGILTLAKDQIIVAMEVNKSTIVSGVDSNGRHFKLPAKYEEIKFAPIPNDLGSKTTLSTLDLFQSKALPMVFAPVESFKDSKDTIVPKGTLLFATKKQKFSIALPHVRSSVVKVFSEDGEVHIGRDVSCSFTAKPEDVAMPLATLVKWLPLPVKVQPFSSDDDINSIDELTLTRIDVERVLTAIVRFTASTRMLIVDIPSSLGIMLEVIRPEEEKQFENIYATAKDEYANFLPKHRESLPYFDPHEGLLLPPEDSPYKGLESSTSESLSSGVYEEVGQRMFGYKFFEKIQASAGSKHPTPVDKPDGHYQHVPTTMCQTGIPPDKPDNSHVANDTHQAMATPSPQHMDPKAYLKRLSLDSIQTLLKAMNLSNYCERFAREQVDGEVFASLDDNMLKELGVTKSIHMLRLKKVIDGTRSAKEIMDGFTE